MGVIKKITVASAKHNNYPIIISAGLFNILPSILPVKSGDQVMVVTNETVAPLYLNSVHLLFENLDVSVDNIILPDGEQYKTLVVLNIIFTALLKKLHNRDTILLALGGGVIGDLTGFAASSYQRGVRFIQMPTTLLSQVDSSIGGKTAVNHSLGKNMIGSFYQPISVIIGLNFLKTLPPRELSSGLAEVIKYGIALDYNFFRWLEENIDALLNLDEQALAYCICYCCNIKSKIVELDENETNLRVLLNLGHTFGHAIENEMGYGNWLHGEAISVGIIMASRVSERLGNFTDKETQRIITLLLRAGLPVTRPCEITPAKYLLHMFRDKKTLSGKIRLILPLSIGNCQIAHCVSQDVILSAITDC